MFLGFSRDSQCVSITVTMQVGNDEVLLMSFNFTSSLVDWWRDEK